MQRILFATLASLTILAACSSPADLDAPSGADEEASRKKKDAGAPDAAPADAGSDAHDAGHDADAAPVPELTYPAFAVNPAQVVTQGGPVLAAPKLQVVTFAGDPYAPSIEQLASKLGTSPYWAQTTSEYGVAAIQSLPPIRLTEQAPAAIDDAQFVPWLASKLASKTSGFGKPDARTIYAVFYPQGTTVTIGSALTGCVNSLGYHWDGVMNDGTDVAYVVMPRCASSANLHGIDTLTSPFAHELIEAVTDPLSRTNQAYFGLDDAHFGFQDVYLEEVGDLCVQDRYLTAQPADLGFTVQRSWSNASARAGHHPCVPAPAVYFNAQPVVHDTTVLTDRSNRTHVAASVNVARGKSKTIDVQLFSDAPTSGPFSIMAYDLATVRGQSAEVMLSLDAGQGKNGDVVHLTITRSATAAKGYSTVMLWSQLNGESNFYPFIVGN